MNKLSINTILITFFLLFSSLLKAEIVQELEINGNKRECLDETQNAMQSNEIT